MNLTIHRGTNTIGGSCVEVCSGSYRIVLDLGMPLMESGGGALDGAAVKKPSVANGILPDVKGLYRDDEPSVDMVILSHPHMDHYGLMDFVHPDIPVWLGRESKVLLEVGGIFYPPEMQQTEVLTHCKTFEHWKPFWGGPFRITSYLMDHSAFGASSLLLEADGKRLFYTGDFRGHGRKTKLFEDMIKDPVEDIDVLLLEGTTLGGKHFAGFATEDEVEGGMADIFKNQDDVSFVMAAGSNVDRLVSIYKAAMATGKTLVVDLYQAYMLDQLKQFSPGLPPHDGDRLRVFYINRHCNQLVEKLGKEALYRYVPRKIEKEEIYERRGDMVLRFALSRMDKLAEIMQKDRSLEKANFIYSMWSGYRGRDPQFNAFTEKYHLNDYNIHTSGHAYLDAAKRLAQALNPKALIPIHTLAGDTFCEHFENVVRLGDGEVYEGNSAG